MCKACYSVDNGFGEEIATGLETYERASYVAQVYLAAHQEDTVLVYSSDGESWELTAKDFA